MTRIINKTLAIGMAFALTTLLARDARAVPVNGSYVDDARCDTVPNTSLQHELGTTLPFPINEGIIMSYQPINAAQGVACIGDDGAPNDWFIRMTNASGSSWKDLFLVVDQGFTIGNADGKAQDNTTPGFEDAFRIDGTVTFGTNDNLIFESNTVNEIFEPGETWEFIMMNFTGGAPAFDSFGFAASSAGSSPSTASILATQVVPEPASLVLLCGGTLLVMRRRRSSPTCG